MPSEQESSSLKSTKKKRGPKAKIPASAKSSQSKPTTEESVSTAQDATTEGDTATNGTNGTSEVSRQEGNNGEAINLEASTSGLVKEVGGGPAEDDSRRSPKDVQSECRDESNASAGDERTPDESSEPLESTPDGLGEKETENLRLQQQQHQDNVYRRMFFMGHFHSSDIIVQIDGRTVMIVGFHGRHADEHGFVTRTFKRKFDLPAKVMAEKLTSFLTGDGVLVIEAPMDNTKNPINKDNPVQSAV